MRTNRPPGFDSRAEREEAAARRLAQLAADLGHDAVAPDRWPAPPGQQEQAEPVEPRPSAPVSPQDVVTPSPIPRAGRHADRRRWRLPGVPGLGVAHVAVLALLVAAALAGTTWWLLRDRATPVTTASSATSADPLVATASATGEEPETTGRVTVDVAGKVRKPGIVVLDEGARVVDAVEAAGGPRRGVETTGINLARVLTDGEQIVVGRPSGEVGGAAPDGAATPVNLNLAGEAELEELPGVGPVTAAAIIAWREEHGGFRSVDQLIDVSGIGEKTLADIAPRVTV